MIIIVSRGLIELTDQKQTTEVNNVVSEAETTLCGVPQGSVLGPLAKCLYSYRDDQEGVQNHGRGV